MSATLVLVLAWTLYLLTHLVVFVTAAPLLLHLGLVVCVCAALVGLYEASGIARASLFEQVPQRRAVNGACIASRVQESREVRCIQMPEF